MTRTEYHPLFCTLAAGGAALDLGTKWLAFTVVGEPQATGPLPKMPVMPGVFSFTTSYNPGALWGLGQNLPYANAMFAGMSLLAAGAFLVWLFGYGGARDRALSAALGLMMAGTIGNCYDRIVHKQVRDFLYFELIDWPIFNLADTCLVSGVLLLMLKAFLDELPHSRRGQMPGVVPTQAESEP